MSLDVLREQQRAFAAHVRRGDPAAFAGIPAARMAVYQGLVANNLDALFGANFPVLRRTLGEHDWEALVHGFLREHHAETPLFTSIGEEFIRYLDQRQGDPAWWVELAHWEWLELAAQIAPSQWDVEGVHQDGDLLTGVPVLDPSVHIAAYAWPVQRIGPESIPHAPASEPVLLMTRRDAHGRVQFSELSPLLYRMLDWLDDAAQPTGRRLVERICDEAQPTDRATFVDECRAMLDTLRREGIIIGTHEPAAA